MSKLSLKTGTALESDRAEIQSFESTAVRSAQAPTLDQAPAEQRHFVRDRVTWTGYILYGYWSFIWAAFGAFVPYLRSQLHLDYGQAALHFSALAMGPFLSGFFGDRVIRGLGLIRTITLGLILQTAGVVLVVGFPLLYCTIAGAFLIGFGGSIMSQSITTSMSTRFGDQRALGIAEYQIAGTLFTLTAPLTVSAVTKAGFDWRVAVCGVATIFVTIALCNRNTIKRLGNSVTFVKRAVGGSSLPLAFWFFAGVIFFSVAAEWTVSFWSAEFLSQIFSLSKSDAASGMSLLIFGMLLGRLSGLRLIRLVPSKYLLSGSATVAALGFLVFWLARCLPINLAGLFLMGLGESNLYPLCLSQALAAGKHATERAAVRMSLSSGGACLLAPLMLGLLADKVGIGNAYGLVAVCLVVAAIAITYGAFNMKSASASIHH